MTRYTCIFIIFYHESTFTNCPRHAPLQYALSFDIGVFFVLSQVGTFLDIAVLCRNFLDNNMPVYRLVNYTHVFIFIIIRRILLMRIPFSGNTDFRVLKILFSKTFHLKFVFPELCL